MIYEKVKSKALEKTDSYVVGYFTDLAEDDELAGKKLDLYYKVKDAGSTSLILKRGHNAMKTPFKSSLFKSNKFKSKSSVLDQKK